MAKKNTKTVFSYILASVMAFVLIVSMGATNVYAAENAQTVYEENKALVSAIDKGDYFTELYNLAVSDGAYIAHLKSAAKVAAAYDRMLKAFSEEQYEAGDYADIVKIFNLTKAYVSLTEENYLSYTEYEAKYLKKISDEQLYIVGHFLTTSEKLGDYKAAALRAVDEKYNALVSVNAANPEGEANKLVGFYDSEGKLEIDGIYNKYCGQIKDYDTQSADTAAVKSGIDLLKETCIREMQAVRKNCVERAYDELQDYYAAVGGNLEGDKEALKQQAADAIHGCGDFFENASPEILKEYSSEKKAFKDFFDENEIDDTFFRNKSSVQTNDGAVRIDAAVDGVAYDIFPANVDLVVYNIKGDSPKLFNAQREISKKNGKISIAYFPDIILYADAKPWNAPSEAGGKSVIYTVTIDLNAYYDNYIVKSESFIEKLLKDIGIKSGTASNKADLIKAVADNYKDDVCYFYYKNGEDGAVKSLKYSLDGGKLMFETDMLGSVAINGNEQASLMTNPIFWVCLILALALVIVIVALVFKFIRYTVKFYLSDGTLIATLKARKGESFVMPVAPKKKSCVFAGWYEDAELKNRFLQTQITTRKNISVYAKYVRELSAEQLNDYFDTLCVKLASNAVLGRDYQTDAESLAIAKVEKTDASVKLYLLLSESDVDKAYGVTNVKVDGLDGEAVLKNVDTVESYNQSLELVDALIEAYKLTPSDPDVDAFSGKDEYVLNAVKPEPEPLSEEELVNYLQALRKEALSYALTAENDKVEDGKMLVKAYKGEDAIYLYFALDAESYGLQPAEGDLSEGTPAMFTVTNEEEFEKAKELINTLMTEYGLEKVIDPSELGEGSSKGFGYRVKFSD